MSGRRRVVVLASIVGLLVAGGVADRARRPDADAPQPRAASRAAPAAAVSSAWYCPGANARADTVADGTVAVVNAGRRALRGSVTVVPDKGDARTVPIEVSPAGRSDVVLHDVVQADNAAALVELDGGEAVAELQVSGPLGFSAAPCASTASDRWSFAEGVTARDASELLMVFNPFPEDAIVDLAFTTEEGRVLPQGLSGLIVRGRSLLPVNVGDSVRRRETVAGTLVARVGRLVVGRVQTFDGSVGRKGVSLALGAPAPEPVWYFPEGLVAAGIVERIQVFNPEGREARVEVSFALERGEAEPIEATVPPDGRVTVAVNQEGRVPEDVPHATVVRATNGVGVVVERTIEAGPPSPRLGLAITMGQPRPAARWLLALGQASDEVDEGVVLYNPGGTEVRARLGVLADGATAPLTEVSVPPGRRAAVRVADFRTGTPLPVVVTASAPVVVERDLYATGSPGTAMAMGVPLS